MKKITTLAALLMISASSMTLAQTMGGSSDDSSSGATSASPSSDSMGGTGSNPQATIAPATPVLPARIPISVRPFPVLPTPRRVRIPRPLRATRI
jgi:hypothetical protein